MFCRDALHASCVMQLMVYREETHAMRLYVGSKYKVAKGLIYQLKCR